MASLQLVFPPLTGVTYPYLSTPSLLAYVHANSEHSATQLDLNIAMVDWLLKPSTLALWADEARAMLQEFEQRPLQGQDVVRYARAANLSVRAESLRSCLPEALAVIRGQGGGLFHPEQISTADRIIADAIEAAAVRHAPESLNLTEPVWRYSASSPSELKAGIEDETNLVYSLYDRLLPGIGFDADVIGISVVYHGQVFPALCLAAWIKKRRPGVRIIVGGPFFTVHRDRLVGEPWLFDVLDAICVFEGEKALVGYLDFVDGKAKLKDVPGLVWRQFGLVLNSGTPDPVDVNELPCPNFDDLPLDSYHLPKRTLPLLTSRGCYWRCAFCTHHYIYGDSYRVRSFENISSDLARLRERWNCSHIYFADESMSPRLLRHISTAVRNAGADVRWGCELRAEQSLVPDDLDAAFESGCRIFSFGVESTNQRVLDSMGKGVSRADIERLFRQCHAAGIHTHFMGIVGFPGETVAESDETFEFLLQNQAVVDLAGFSFFYLLRHSPVDRNPEKYWVTGLRDLRDDLRFEERKNYAVSQGLTMAQSFDRWSEMTARPDIASIALRHGHSVRDRFLFSPGTRWMEQARVSECALPGAARKQGGVVSGTSHDLAVATTIANAFMKTAGRRYNLEGVTLGESWRDLTTPSLQPSRPAQIQAFSLRKWESYVLEPLAAYLLVQLSHRCEREVLSEFDDHDRPMAVEYAKVFRETGLV